MDKIVRSSQRKKSVLTSSVIKAMSVFGGVQMVNIVCAAVRAKLLAVFAGPAAVGLLAIYNSALAALTAATQLNFNQSAVRDIAASSGEERRKIITATGRWGRRLGLFGMAVTLFLSPLLSLWSFGNYDATPAFAILSVTLLLGSLSGARQAVLQGTRMLKVLASASVWGYIIATVVAAGLVMAFGIRAVVPVILVIFVAQWGALTFGNKISFKSAAGNKEVNEIGKRFLILGGWMTAASFITLSLAYVFALYLAREWSESVVGYYQAGYTMVNAYIGLLFNAIVMEYYPRLSSVATSPRRMEVLVSHEVTMVVWCLIPALCLFAAVADVLVRLLYSSEFLVSLPYILIATVGVVLRAFSWSMAYTILARGDGKTYVVTEALSSAAGLGLNIIMFRVWGFEGLGIAYVIWYAIYTLIVWYVYRFKYRMRVGRGVILLCLAATLLIGGGVAGKIYAGWWIPAAIAATTAVPAWKILSGHR